MSMKALVSLIVALVAVVVVVMLRETPDNTSPQESTGTDASNVTSESNSASTFSVGLGEIDKMSVQDRRRLYKSFGDRDPYVPVGTILPILDRGLADPDLKVRLHAINRFVMSHYIYGRNEPSSLFNDDPDRQAVFVRMLGDDNAYIREGSFRVLAENFSEQQDVATALADAVRVEDSKRLSMLRSFAAVMNTHPQIASQVYIDEVKLGASSDHPGTPVDSASILAMSGTPPAEILEPVIELLEERYFGSPALLTVLEEFGPEAKPYLDRLKLLQVRIDERILNSRDNQGTGSTTFSRERYAAVLNQIENAT